MPLYIPGRYCGSHIQWRPQMPHAPLAPGLMSALVPIVIYRKVSSIKRTLVGNKIVDHSDEVGASPVGAAPTTSTFSTEQLVSMDWAKTTARREEKHLCCGFECVLYWRIDGIFSTDVFLTGLIDTWGPLEYCLWRVNICSTQVALFCQITCYR